MYDKDAERHIIVGDSKFFSDDRLSRNIDLCDDITSYFLPETLDEIEFQIDRLKRRWNEFTYLIGQRLKYINTNQLYSSKGYKDFSTYVKVALKMSENNAYYYICIFDYFTEEQTKIAGSKLKLIIPVINKIKKDKELPGEKIQEEINKVKVKLYNQIYNKSYREAESIIRNFRRDVLKESKENYNDIIKKITIKKDRIVILENDKNKQDEIIGLLEDYYKYN